MNSRVALVVLTSILAFFALVGCGLEGQPFDSSDATTAAPEPGAAVVTPDAISAYPQDSPEAAALRWWRAIQTRDPEAVFASYTSEVRNKLPKDFAGLVVAFVAPSAAQSSFAIDYVEPTNGDEVTLYAVIDGSPDIRMNGPLALPMTKDEDKWLITDATFIEALLAGVETPGPAELNSPTETSQPTEGSK